MEITIPVRALLEKSDSTRSGIVGLGYDPISLEQVAKSSLCGLLQQF
jgi:hypothetical protein